MLSRSLRSALNGKQLAGRAGRGLLIDRLTVAGGLPGLFLHLFSFAFPAEAHPPTAPRTGDITSDGGIHTLRSALWYIKLKNTCWLPFVAVFGPLCDTNLVRLCSLGFSPAPKPGFMKISPVVFA